MAISQKDIKLLWGRSGNRCAICKIELTQDCESNVASFTLGEQAHIVGEQESAARGKSTLTIDERNSYHNLILLCPNHHTEIDKNVDDWSVEKLHHTKSKHELWVSDTLSETANPLLAAKQTAIDGLINSAVELCELENWINWTSFLLTPDSSIDTGMPEKIHQFRNKVISTVWPAGQEFEGLKKSIVTFSMLLHYVAQSFLKHAEKHDDRFYVYRFYKAHYPNENYEEDLKRFEDWQDNWQDKLREATKALNWFADEVRNIINPMFFIEHGKFLVSEGPFSGFKFRTSLYEFTELEKQKYPEAVLYLFETSNI